MQNLTPNPVRRAFILTGEAPDRPGGVEHFIRELKKGLEARGYRVEILHRENSMPAWMNGRSGRIGSKIAGSLLGYFLGRNAEKRIGQDVVAVISNGGLGFYPFKNSSPSLKRIHFYHGTYRGQAEAIRPFISRLGYLYLKWWESMGLECWSGQGRLVLCNSDQTRDEVRRFFGLEGVTVWLPLDTQHFRPLERLACRSELKLPEEGAVGIFAGSVHPMKGFTVVRSLIRAMPHIRWILALRGDVPTELASNPAVRIFQNASYEQLPLLYGAADFSLCPSRYEPFGYVVAEALACGTPVIASPGGASRLFLQEQPLSQLLVPTWNTVDKFLAAAREVLREPQYFRRMVLERVRPRVEEIMAPENWRRRFFEVTGL